MKKAILWVFVISILYSVCLFLLKKYYLDEKTFNLFLLPLGIAYMWIPGTVALIFSKKEKISLPIFKKPNKYILYACFVPIVITLMVFLINFLFAKMNPIDLSVSGLNKLCFFSSSALNYFLIACITMVSGILIGGTLNILTTLGEELMWRGFNSFS